MKNQETKTDAKPTLIVDRREIVKQLIGLPALISLALNVEALGAGKVLPDDLKITSEGFVYGPVVAGDSSLSGYPYIYFDKKPLKGADDGQYFFTLSSFGDLTVPATILVDNTSTRALNLAFKLTPLPPFNPPNIASIEFNYLTPYNLPGTPTVAYSYSNKKGEEVTAITIGNADVMVNYQPGVTTKKAKKGRVTITQVRNAEGTTVTLEFKQLFDLDADVSFKITLLRLVGGASSNKPQTNNN